MYFYINVKLIDGEFIEKIKKQLLISRFNKDNV